MPLTYDQITAITEKKFLPKAVDNIFKSIPLMQRLQKKMQKLDGGTSVLQPLNYAQASSGGWYSGADTLNNTDNDIITSAEFQWAQIYQSISISRRDELKNSGDAQKLNFVKTKMQVAEKSIRDTVATGCYNSGTDSKAIVGARTFISTSNTYGGISQSTYSWWQSNVDSTTTTLSISALQSQWSNASLNGDSPSVILSTSANYDRYYALLQPQQRFMDSETAKAGFTSLMFNGVPYIMDSKCPTGYVLLLNEEYLDLYVHKDENFRLEPFASPINQNVKVAHIFAMLCLASSNNRMHAGLTAITA
jgi:hypothetical protein